MKIIICTDDIILHLDYKNINSGTIRFTNYQDCHKLISSEIQ